MPKMTDYVTLWEKYQREGVPQKIPIERFCVMNGYTYKQFEQWYKTDRNVSFTPLELSDPTVSSEAPAATLDVLANALIGLYKSETEVKVIGTRHGEKLYETLVTREEMAKSEDMGNYFRIPCDTRDLNYDKFFVEGEEKISRIEDYHSHNTSRLDVQGMQQLLLKLDMIREDLNL